MYCVLLKFVLPLYVILVTLKQHLKSQTIPEQASQFQEVEAFRFQKFDA